MTTEMIRLEKLYAKGELVWQDKNEWDANIGSQDSVYLMMQEQGDFLYVSLLTKLNKLDKRTGEVVWTIDYETSLVSNTASFVATNEHGFAYSRSLVYVINHEDGSLFQTIVGLGGDATRSRGITTDGAKRIFIANDKKIHCYELGDTEYTKKWSVEHDKGIGCIIYHKGFVYSMNTSSIQQLSAETGEEIAKSSHGDYISESKYVIGFVVNNKPAFIAADSSIFIIDPSTSLVTKDEKKPGSMDYPKPASNGVFVNNDSIFYSCLIENTSGTLYKRSYCANYDFTQKNYVELNSDLAYIAGGSNDHIYIIYTNKNIIKRKLSKGGTFNLKLQKTLKNGGLFNGNID